MTKVMLLERLKAFTEERTCDLLLPVQPSDEDEHPAPRAAKIYVPRLPELRDYESKAPFITHEILTGKDGIEMGERSLRYLRSMTTVRTCFCVYNEDEQEGSMALLNLMERVRVGLLEEIWLGKQFELDVDAGLGSWVYPEDPYQQSTEPFYKGEMVSVWKLPPIERKVKHGQGNSNFERQGPGPGCLGGTAGICKKDFSATGR